MNSIFQKFGHKAALAKAGREVQQQDAAAQAKALQDARDQLGQVALKVFNLLIPGAIQKIDIWAHPLVVAPGQPERKLIGSVLLSKLGAFEVLDVDIRPESQAPADAPPAPAGQGADAPKV